MAVAYCRAAPRRLGHCGHDDGAGGPPRPPHRDRCHQERVLPRQGRPQARRSAKIMTTPERGAAERRPAAAPSARPQFVLPSPVTNTRRLCAPHTRGFVVPLTLDPGGVGRRLHGHAGPIDRADRSARGGGRPHPWRRNHGAGAGQKQDRNRPTMDVPARRDGDLPTARPAPPNRPAIRSGNPHHAAINPPDGSVRRSGGKVTTTGVVIMCGTARYAAPSIANSRPRTSRPDARPAGRRCSRNGYAGRLRGQS